MATKKQQQYSYNLYIIAALALLQLCNHNLNATTLAGGDKRGYVHGQRRMDVSSLPLSPQSAVVSSIAQDQQINNNYNDSTSVNRLINLSNLNVSFNHNKLKGYKLRQLFSKISINGSEPIVEQQQQQHTTSDNQNEDTIVINKNKNDIEVISVDLKDVDIPVTMPVSTMDAALKLLVPSSSNGADTTVQSIKFTQNHLTMTGVNLRLLNMQLYKDSEPKCDLQFTIGNTTVNGRFSFSTQLMLIDLHLEGRYTMQVDDIYVKAATKFAKETNGSNVTALKTKDLDLNITSMGRINLNLYHDVDDEDIGSTDNSYWFKILNRVLHKTIKRTYYMFENEIKQSLEGASKKSLDEELAHFMPYLSYNTSQQQDLVASVRQEMVRSKFVTNKLPDYYHSNRLLGLEAKINFTNGLLSEIDTLKLTGDSKIKIQDLHLLVNTSIGWSELVATYDWRLNIGFRGKVKFSIKEVGSSFWLLIVSFHHLPICSNPICHNPYYINNNQTNLSFVNCLNRWLSML